MSYTICQTDALSAREAIVDLWRRNLPEALADRYTWLYETGPATGFLLRSEPGLAVGAAGLMRREFHAFGEPLTAGQAIDLNVDREHRTIGPALALQRAVLKAVESRDIDLAYGFPNRQSEAVLRYAGYRALGELQRWVKPLTCRVAFDRWGWPRWLARSLAILADPILRGIVTKNFYRRRRDIRVEQVDSFDARFDRLWQSARGQWPILGERTSAYLNWRFCRCPDLCYRALCLTGPSGDLLAYVVHGRRGGTVHVADLLFADETYLDPLLTELMRLVRREKAQTLVVLHLGNPAVGQALTRFGFWQRPSGRKAMVYLGRDGEGDTSPFANPQNWHLTGADIDTDG